MNPRDYYLKTGYYILPQPQDPASDTTQPSPNQHYPQQPIPQPVPRQQPRKGGCGCGGQKA